MSMVTTTGDTITYLRYRRVPMRNRVLTFTLLLMMFSSLFVWPLSSRAAPNNPNAVPDTFPPYMSQYYKETGHASVNSFHEFWRRTPNALFVLGFPISQPFIE